MIRLSWSFIPWRRPRTGSGSTTDTAGSSTSMATPSTKRGPISIQRWSRVCLRKTRSRRRIGGVHLDDAVDGEQDTIQTETVTPIISGPSQSGGIARFALRATYDDLTAERRERLKLSILDAVACAINAIGARPIEASRR